MTNFSEVETKKTNTGFAAIADTLESLAGPPRPALSVPGPRRPTQARPTVFATRSLGTPPDNDAGLVSVGNIELEEFYIAM